MNGDGKYVFTSMPTKELKVGRIRLLHAKCKELLVPKHQALTVKLQSLLTSEFGRR